LLPGHPSPNREEFVKTCKWVGHFLPAGVDRIKSALTAETPLLRLVELAHLRWPVEKFYEDAKGECGFDHFQGRSWTGLHRHLALVMLAYSFLMIQS